MVNLVNMSILCWLYDTRNTMREISSQCHGWVIPPWNCIVPMTAWMIINEWFRQPRFHMSHIQRINPIILPAGVKETWDLQRTADLSPQKARVCISTNTASHCQLQANKLNKQHKPIKEASILRCLLVAHLDAHHSSPECGSDCGFKPSGSVSPMFPLMLAINLAQPSPSTGGRGMTPVIFAYLNIDRISDFQQNNFTYFKMCL